MSKFQEIKELVANMEKDADAFYTNRNKAAGRRHRSDLQTLKVLAQEGRKEVIDLVNAGKEA